MAADPEFTDTARAALLWVLWHHQGGSSPVGQPIRFALGMGQFDRLTPEQLAQAKSWGAPRAGPAHAGLTLDANEVRFLAARLRRLFAHFGVPVPNEQDDGRLIGIAGAGIGLLLTGRTDGVLVTPTTSDEPGEVPRG